jgi:hypothetical protein
MKKPCSSTAGWASATSGPFARASPICPSITSSLIRTGTTSAPPTGGTRSACTPNGKGELARDHSKRCGEVIQGWGDGLPFPPGFEPENYTIPPATFGWEVKEGDTIDLGGRTLRV